MFIDDGYVDMKRAMAIYEKCGFAGTIIPDHTPRLDAADWWETGMAFALGFMRGLMDSSRGHYNHVETGGEFQGVSKF